jgi:pimeloyl-ACP methyl ester carboxylesterase
MLDYRGYGKSTGRIQSEAQLLADVQAAWASIAARYAGRPVVFFGRSLGTGLATQLAAALPAAERPDLLLLVSPYRSLEVMAREHYPFVPVSLLRYPMRSDAALQALAQATGGGPRVVLVHGEQDNIIGPEHARALSALSPGSRLELIPGAGHNDLQSFDGYRAVIRSALADALRRAPGPDP